MLQVKFFPLSDQGSSEFNAFMAIHAPRNSEKSPGIAINQNGIVVFFEEGQPFSKQEQIGTLMESLAKNKTQILIAEPQLRIKEAETIRFKQLLIDSKESLANQTESSKQKYDHEKQIKELEQKIEANEAWILTTRAGAAIAREQNAAYQSLIDTIEKGEWEA